MTLDFQTLVLCIFSALAYAGVLLLLKDKTTPFWQHFLAFLAGILVFASQSILGYKIAALVPAFLA